MSWQLIPARFTGAATLDILAFRAGDGAFAKWYGGDFLHGSNYQAVQYIGSNPGTWKDARLLPVDFNGDGNQDVLAFHPSDGAFAKWYSDGSVRPDFNYQAVQYIGGQAGRWPDAQLIPIDFNGDGNIDILAFRPSDGAFAKWYSDGSVRPDFNYQAVQYIGGKPGTWSDAQLIPIDFNGDGNVDILAFRPSDGAFAKWYSDGSIRPDFNYQSVQYIGGQPNTWSGARLIPADFNGDGKIDILAFLPDAEVSVNRDASISLVAKWFSDATIGPGFDYQRVLRITVRDGGGSPSLDLIPVDLDGDGKVDFLAFFPNVDAFTTWLENLSGFQIAPYSFGFDTGVRWIGGGVTFHD